MGFKRGQNKFAKNKPVAAVYLEENWALNFDEVTEDSAITKGNILCYLLDTTVNDVAHKLAHLSSSGDKKVMYGRIRRLLDYYVKKYSHHQGHERVRRAMETFCVEPFVINVTVPQHEVAPPSPEMMETEDSTNETPQATITTYPSTPAKTRNQNFEQINRAQRSTIHSNKETMKDLRGTIYQLKTQPVMKQVRNLNVSE